MRKLQCWSTTRCQSLPAPVASAGRRIHCAYNSCVYKTPAKLALGAQLFGAPGIFVLALFVAAHLAIAWSTRWTRTPTRERSPHRTA